MAAAWQVKTVGLDKLLKKLDANEVVEPEKTALLKTAADETKASLGPTLPRRTGASARKIASVATPQYASVTVPRYPFVFLEAGTQYHAGPGQRQRRRRTAEQWRGGTYRIRPRRFLSRERAKVRKRLVLLIERLKTRVEKAWAA